MCQFHTDFTEEPEKFVLYQPSVSRKQPLEKSELKKSFFWLNFKLKYRAFLNQRKIQEYRKTTCILKNSENTG